MYHLFVFVLLSAREITHSYWMCLTDVDECENGTNDCDPVFGTCENTVGSYTCQCEPGFTGDGKSCSGKVIPDS